MRLYNSFQSEEAERYWFAFILYSVKRLTQKNEESGKEETENTGLTLCRILRAAKLKYFPYFFVVYKFVVCSIIYCYRLSCIQQHCRFF